MKSGTKWILLEFAIAVALIAGGVVLAWSRS